MRGHEIRMTDQQWAAFKALGGAAWLRDLLDAPAKVNPQRDLINRVVADSRFLGIEQLSAKYNRTPATIKRTLR